MWMDGQLRPNHYAFILCALRMERINIQTDDDDDDDDDSNKGEDRYCKHKISLCQECLSFACMHMFFY
jgi:hypothetical protein